MTQGTLSSHTWQLCLPDGLCLSLWGAVTSCDWCELRGGSRRSSALMAVMSLCVHGHGRSVMIGIDQEPCSPRTAVGGLLCCKTAPEATVPCCSSCAGSLTAWTA